MILSRGDCGCLAARPPGRDVFNRKRKRLKRFLSLLYDFVFTRTKAKPYSPREKWGEPRCERYGAKCEARARLTSATGC